MNKDFKVKPDHKVSKVYKVKLDRKDHRVNKD